MQHKGRDFLLIDTAGLRRRTKIKEQVEFYSSVRTRESLERCDIAVVLVDAEEGCTVQDAKLVERAVGLGKGAVLAINKWDLVEKDDKTTIKYTRQILSRFVSIGNHPILFISALTGQRSLRVIDTALEVYDRRKQRISTGHLNRFLEHLNGTTAPPSKNGRVFRMTYCVQPRSEPPTFLFFTSRPKDVPAHYRRFLERRLRETFDLVGTPVRVLFKKK
jgi:GTP-binding protein